MLLLKLVLDVWSVEKSLKGVQELELSNDGVAVIETLSQDGGESSLQLLDALSELEEVIVKLSSLNIHDVIFDLHEFLDSLFEFFVDLFDCLSQGVTLGVTDINLRQLLELND